MNCIMVSAAKSGQVLGIVTSTLTHWNYVVQFQPSFIGASTAIGVHKRASSSIAMNHFVFFRGFEANSTSYCRWICLGLGFGLNSVRTELRGHILLIWTSFIFATL